MFLDTFAHYMKEKEGVKICLWKAHPKHFLLLPHLIEKLRAWSFSGQSLPVLLKEENGQLVSLLERTHFLTCWVEDAQTLMVGEYYLPQEPVSEHPVGELLSTAALEKVFREKGPMRWNGKSFSIGGKEVGYPEVARVCDLTQAFSYPPSGPSATSVIQIDGTWFFGSVDVERLGRLMFSKVARHSQVLDKMPLEKDDQDVWEFSSCTCNQSECSCPEVFLVRRGEDLSFVRIEGDLGRKRHLLNALLHVWDESYILAKIHKKIRTSRYSPSLRAFTRNKRIMSLEVHLPQGCRHSSDCMCSLEVKGRAFPFENFQYNGEGELEQQVEEVVEKLQQYVFALTTVDPESIMRLVLAATEVLTMGEWYIRTNSRAPLSWEKFKTLLGQMGESFTTIDSSQQYVSWILQSYEEDLEKMLPTIQARRQTVEELLCRWKKLSLFPGKSQEQLVSRIIWLKSAFFLKEDQGFLLGKVDWSCVNICSIEPGLVSLQRGPAYRINGQNVESIGQGMKTVVGGVTVYWHELELPEFPERDEVVYEQDVGAWVMREGRLYLGEGSSYLTAVISLYKQLEVVSPDIFPCERYVYGWVLANDLPEQRNRRGRKKATYRDIMSKVAVTTDSPLTTLRKDLRLKVGDKEYPFNSTYFRQDKVKKREGIWRLSGIHPETRLFDVWVEMSEEGIKAFEKKIGAL